MYDYTESIADTAAQAGRLSLQFYVDTDDGLAKQYQMLEHEPRFAFVKSPVWDRASAQTQDAFEKLNDFLGENCDLINLPTEFDTVVENHQNIMCVEMSRNLADFMTKGEEKLSEKIRALFKESTNVKTIDYNDSIDQILPLRA